MNILWFFNGEIYNFKKLIKKHSLKDTNSDTLTLFNLLETSWKECNSTKWNV